MYTINHSYAIERLTPVNTIISKNIINFSGKKKY